MALRLALLALLVACSSGREQSNAPAGSGSAKPARVPHLVADDRNILATDYIGPNACGECHGPQFAAWSTSLHRVMNMKADDPGAVIGDFKSATVPYGAGTAKMERDLVGYAMTTQDRERTTRYRVTRTIGHRRLQEYVGVEDGAHEEVRLPFGWWPRAGGWMAQNQFDPWLDAHFDPFAPVRDAWAERCPWCHSTYPFAQRIVRSSGEHPIGHGLEQLFTLPNDVLVANPQRLDVSAQVTTGISCESCHLGGRAHAEGGPIQFLPRGAVTRADAPTLPATFKEQRTNASVVNMVCAQCHSGPSPRLADGTALRNSSEALDLAASKCSGLRCTDCHDPHKADAEPDEAKAVAVCSTCHAAQAIATHGGEPHAGKANCLDCHMPKIVMGIDRYVRTHRISSPTNTKLLAEAAPNACNLCHLDRSIDWTLTELRLGWDVKLAPAREKYGSNDASVGDVWLASSSPALRLIAAHAYTRSPLGRYALAEIKKGLSDPLPYVQVWTRFAVEAIMKSK